MTTGVGDFVESGRVGEGVEVFSFDADWVQLDISIPNRITDLKNCLFINIFPVSISIINFDF